MSINIQFPFDTPSNYTYDNTKIDVTGGVAKLKLQDNTGLQFNQPFDSDTGFTYDAAKAEFTGGLVRQIDNIITGAKSWATFTSVYNLSYGSGTLTGTPTGTVAITGNMLDLSGGVSGYVDYAGIGNVDSQQTGAIRFKIKPNYSGNPASDQYFTVISENSGSDINKIALYQLSSNGFISLVMLNNAGGIITSTSFGLWNPTAGNTYEFELNFDVTAGAVRMFIDGTQLGTTKAVTGTRSSSIDLLRIGDSRATGKLSNFYMSDFIYFSTVQHTSNYTPSGTALPEARYLGSTVELPQFSYSGVGAIQAFTNYVTTEAGTPKFIINDLYWDGAAWSASDGTYNQANTAAEVLANIASLTASDTVDIDIVFTDSVSLSSVSDLTLTYTGQIYLTTNPTIEGNTSWIAQALDGYTETSTKTGSDEIKYILKKGDDWYYWDGSAWEISDETYSQANTDAEIETNKASFVSYVTTSKFRALLHSDDGSTTPELDLLSIDYDHGGETPDTINTCIVWGYNKNADNTVNTSDVTFELTREYVEYKTNIIIKKSTLTATPETETGYFEIELVENVNMVEDTQYKVTIGNRVDYITVPNESTKNINDLLGA